MPYLLEDLVVDRIDFVYEGADSAAFIEVYKRKETVDKMELKDIIAKMNPEHATVVQAELDKLTSEVSKSVADKAAIETELLKANEDLKETKEELEKVNTELGSLKEASAPFDETETLKAMPEAAREIFMKMKMQKETAEEAVRKAKENEATATAVAKAAEFKALPVQQDKLVEILKSASTDVIEVFANINAAIVEGTLKEIGKSHSGGSTTSEDAWGKIEAKAAEIMKSSTGLSKAKAITKAIDENPDLYREYLKEEGGTN